MDLRIVCAALLVVAGCATRTSGDGGEGGAGGASLDTGATQDVGAGAGYAGETTAEEAAATTGTTSGAGGASSTGATTGGSTSASSTAATSTAASGGGSCAHDVCTAGDPLDAMCDDCATAVCQNDDFCCDPNGTWDDVCIGEVAQYCGVDCGGGGGGGGGGVPGPGDLVITEIMNNPAAVADASGEWFEVYNATASPIDLMGLGIRHDAADPTKVHTIASSVVVAAKGYAVLGINGDPATNGGVAVDYVYAGVNLSNTTDMLAMIVPGQSPVVIDETHWDSTKLAANGQSRSLDPIDLAADLNDDDTAFCQASSYVNGNAGDKGTPAKPNDPCP